MDLKNIEVNIPDYKNAVEEAKKRAKELSGKKEELRRLIGYIDLTTLSGDDRRSVVEKLTDRAVQPWDQDKTVHCTAVCVYPARVLDVTNRLKTHPNNKVHVASGRNLLDFLLTGSVVSSCWRISIGTISSAIAFA
jgi:hypothetical protein